MQQLARQSAHAGITIPCMGTDFNASISASLVAFMADQEISKRAVAHELGRSENYVSQRTTGVYDLSVDIIGAVAALARISPRALMVELSDRLARASDSESLTRDVPVGSRGADDVPGVGIAPTSGTASEYSRPRHDGPPTRVRGGARTRGGHK